MNKKAPISGGFDMILSGEFLKGLCLFCLRNFTGAASRINAQKGGTSMKQRKKAAYIIKTLLFLALMLLLASNAW
jgi:hypothetical protein